MVKKAERDSQNDLTSVQGDIDGDMTLSETAYSGWHKTLSVETLLLHRVCYQNWSKVLT